MVIKYLKRRWLTAALFAVLALVFALVLSLYDLPTESVLYASLLCVVLGVFAACWDYTRWRRRARALELMQRTICVSDAGLPDAKDYTEELYQELRPSVHAWMRRRRRSSAPPRTITRCGRTR